MSINKITCEFFKKNSVSTYFEDSIDSTNNWAKQIFTEKQSFSVFLTDSQSQGRGRGTNSWSQSTPGETLLSTWCLALSESPQPIFSIRAGLALLISFRSIGPDLPWALKAPNDIYLDTGKFAGILIELSNSQKNVLSFIGIGANIFAKPSLMEQTTACLTDFADFKNEDWHRFCLVFKNALLDLQKDPQRQLLTKIELQNLNDSLKKYSQNKIDQLLPDGSLRLHDGTLIHWSSL